MLRQCVKSYAAKDAAFAGRAVMEFFTQTSDSDELFEADVYDGLSRVIRVPRRGLSFSMP